MVEASDFGVVGDGISMNTRAIQRALDTGEVVHFSAGVYLSGTLFLRSGGGLDLDEGATLKASPCKTDYNPDDISVHNVVFRQERVSGAHFIYAENLHDVTIRGQGCISGNGRCFFDIEKILGDEERPYYQDRGWRPGQMLFFYGCTKVTVRDVLLEDAPYWNCLFLNCEDILAENIRIHSDRKIINTDGIDIDCSRRVRVTGCRIDCGDDCVAIRANEKAVGDDAPCTDVLVEKCVCRSPACAVRIGVGNGMIRNAIVRELDISGSTVGIGMCPCYSPESCVQMEDVRVEECRIDAKQALVLVPYWGVLQTQIQTKPIRNFRFASLRLTSRMPCIFVAPEGQEGLYSNFVFDGVSLCMKTPVIPPQPYRWPLKEYGAVSFLHMVPAKMDIRGTPADLPMLYRG